MLIAAVPLLIVGLLTYFQSSAAMLEPTGEDMIARGMRRFFSDQLGQRDTICGMENIRQKIGLSTEKVEEMGKRSEEIVAIVETIEDIASQTNLLALNAAIETPLLSL